MTIQLVGEWPSELASAAKTLHRALSADTQVKLPDGMVNLQLVDDDQITELNKQYTGNAYATDVLTFPYDTTDQSGAQHNEDPTIADVVISRPTAQRQAEQVGTDLADEIGLLVLHGLLHASGYDHDSDEGRSNMEAVQQRVMAAANLTYRDFKWHQ